MFPNCRGLCHHWFNAATSIGNAEATTNVSIDELFDRYVYQPAMGAAVMTADTTTTDTTTAEATDESATAGTDSVVLTDTAAVKVKTLLDQEGRDDLALRVAVQPGGCSGLRYQLFFDDRSLDGDQKIDFDGVAVVVDRMSVPYLGGAVIDFVDTIEKQGFTIDNPNATGSCACGDSFH